MSISSLGKAPARRGTARQRSTRQARGASSARRSREQCLWRALRLIVGRATKTAPPDWADGNPGSSFEESCTTSLWYVGTGFSAAARFALVATAATPNSKLNFHIELQAKTLLLILDGSLYR